MSAAYVCVRVDEKISVEQAGQQRHCLYQRNQTFEDRQSTLRTPLERCGDQVVFVDQPDRDGMRQS
jgi:hypothetical protein